MHFNGDLGLLKLSYGWCNPTLVDLCLPFDRPVNVCMYCFCSKSSQFFNCFCSKSSQIILLTPSQLKSILGHFSSRASQFSTNKVTPRWHHINYSMLFTAPIAKCKFIYSVLYAFMPTRPVTGSKSARGTRLPWGGGHEVEAPKARESSSRGVGHWDWCDWCPPPQPTKSKGGSRSWDWWPYRHMASTELEPITGSGGCAPSGVQGQSPWPGVQRAKPPKAKRFFVLWYAWNGAKLLCLWSRTLILQDYWGT